MLVLVDACLGSSGPANASPVTAYIDGLSVAVQAKDGTYEIQTGNSGHSVIHARVAAEIDHKWVRSTDYPKHEISQSAFEDALGHGKKFTVISSGLPNLPDLEYTLQIYDGRALWCHRGCSTKSHGQSDDDPKYPKRRGRRRPRSSISDGAQKRRPQFSRIASARIGRHCRFSIWKSSSGDAPRRRQPAPLQPGKQGEFVCSGLSLPTDCSRSFICRRNLRHHGGIGIASYTIDSTGTTEIQATDPESGLREGPAENLIELSVPLAAGESITSERLMFAAGKNYHSQLENYGATIRELHHSRVSADNMLGWWSWTAFYTKITQGTALTNAQWLAEHLRTLGFDYFHFDLGYGYARSEYATPNASQFPGGMWDLTHRIGRLGLKIGVWTAPFEVGGRAWIYEHHKDWLVHNAHGDPIPIGDAEEVEGERLFVLDVTHPDAQEYLRQTYHTLVREWGARYIKLDFMDNTAIEGYYHRPNTTALEAQRIGLEIIRKAVGEDVLLDKDGSPMLNPVGLVDEGRTSQDTGHAFLRSKEAAPGIAARYYMHRNFFIADPDAFTVSRQLLEERTIQAPLALNEAQVSITLAAISGGMYEIGDDLPTLGSDPERLALVTNPDLLAMARLGRAALPLDLLTYAEKDEQPSVFLLHQDQRQSMLAVFNWTEHPASHSFAFTRSKSSRRAPV